MIIRIDHSLPEPLYMQVRNAIITAIAQGELVPGAHLPSVRSLASDLGINLHTVNKAYAVLRDEGYLVMRGRFGASVADRSLESSTDKFVAEETKMKAELYAIALAHRARGGARQDFIDAASAEAEKAYEGRD